MAGMEQSLSAGALLRRARTEAPMTQAELAARAGVTQSVISAYETGHRQPALPTLAAIIEAAGFELVTGIRRPTRRLAGLTGPVGRLGAGGDRNSSPPRPGTG
jgi:uncharacterized protein